MIFQYIYFAVAMALTSGTLILVTHGHLRQTELGAFTDYNSRRKLAKIKAFVQEWSLKLAELAICFWVCFMVVLFRMS